MTNYRILNKLAIDMPFQLIMCYCAKLGIRCVDIHMRNISP